MSADPLRIGCLGAARIAPAALIKPASNVEGVAVTAVAARDHARAESFARKHRIPIVYRSYQELVDAPDLDAVYIPLPNGLHAKWALAALEAGKHVLCEKPFAANAVEVERVAKAAAGSGLVVMEAFHWRYHPLASRMMEIIASGELGQVRHIEASLVFPLPRWSDIRWQLDLAGGSLMDAGCYPVHIVRTLAGEEPDVTSAGCHVRTPGIDRWITAGFTFPRSGATGKITAGMWAAPMLRIQARIAGDQGEMRVINPIAPQHFNLITTRAAGRTRRERVRGRPTYEYQLRAFVAAVRDGGPIPTGLDDSIANMRVIDSIYRKAGLEPRQGATDLPGDGAGGGALRPGSV
jgi:predicted dehydrogenase